MSEKLEDVFDQLHRKLAKRLLERVESGEATSQELNVARQFLKDNGIDGLPEGDDPLGELAKVLPQFDEEGNAIAH